MAARRGTCGLGRDMPARRMGPRADGGRGDGAQKITVLNHDHWQGDQGNLKNLIPPSLILIPDIPDIPEVPWIPSGAGLPDIRGP